MFERIKRYFSQRCHVTDAEFYQQIDALNVDTGGGQPVLVTENLAWLPLRSDSIAIADPRYVPGVVVSGVNSDKLEIVATCLKYPNGQATVAALTLQIGDAARCDSQRIVGELEIDSAKMIVADKADIDEHWTEVGDDRVGVILTPKDDEHLRMIERKFRLKTVQVNRIRNEVVGPVSIELEADIVAFLKTMPKYAKYPFMWFNVQTSNSFERVNYLESSWDIIPVGNQPKPLMFACGTGRGDGVYKVQGHFEGEIPRLLTIDFFAQHVP